MYINIINIFSLLDMNYYWRNYTNFVLLYSDDGDMKGCVSSYTDFFRTNEMNLTRIFHHVAGEDKYQNLLDEFADEEAILINFLPPDQTEVVAAYIATKTLNITMISFQELSKADVNKFPTTRDDKYSFYMASQLLELDIEADEVFKNAYQYVIDNKDTPIAYTPVAIADFTTEEKILYLLLLLNK